MPGKLQIAGYTYSATGMTGKSDHPARWRTEWIGLKHPTDTNVRGVHAAQFSKTAAPSNDGTRRSSRMGQAPGLAQRDEGV